jgi:hypothetical protein
MKEIGAYAIATGMAGPQVFAAILIKGFFPVLYRGSFK